jgi:SnoaL-like domain
MHVRNRSWRATTTPRGSRLMKGSGVRDQEIRAALDQHWAASDANDFETEHRVYHEDAVLEYPQSGERTRGRRNIQSQRASQPSNKRFAVRRIIGSGDLWITEFILTYDGKPSYTVSIMEFNGVKVARETQYFADPFVAPASRAQWVERMDPRSRLGGPASSEAIPSWPVPFRRARAPVGFWGANAAEAAPHPRSSPASRNRRTNPLPARSW